MRQENPHELMSEGSTFTARLSKNDEPSSIERFLKYSGNREKISEALEEISKVHKIQLPYRIGIEDFISSQVDGQLIVEGIFPKKIVISEKCNDPMFAVLHEVGHLIDYLCIPGRYEFANNKIKNMLSNWWKVVKKTEAYKNLAGMRPKNGIIKKRIKYLLTPDELWARSYSQYIATKSSHPQLRKELSVNLSSLYPKQWNEDDFREIEVAIDELLRRLKWK